MKKYYLKITTSLSHVNKFVPKHYIFIKSYRQKEWTLGQQVFKNLHSWLAITWQGGHIRGVLEVITIACFFYEFTWKWGLVPTGEKLFLTLTHHQYGCRDIKCKPAIVIHFNLLQVYLSELPFVFALLFIPSSTVVSGYFCFQRAKRVVSDSPGLVIFVLKSSWL